MEQKTYAEQIVKGKKTGTGFFLQIGAIILAVILLAVITFIPQIAVVAPALAAAIIIFTFLAVRNVNVEYEYDVAQSRLAVDIIRGKSGRKRMFATDVKDFELLAFLEEGEDISGLKGGVQTVYDVRGTAEGDTWYALFSSGGEEGKTLLLFKPNPRVLDVILRYVPPRNVKRSACGKGV